MANPGPIIKSLSQLTEKIWLHFLITISMFKCTPMTTMPLLGSNSRTDWQGQNLARRLSQSVSLGSSPSTFPPEVLIREIHLISLMNGKLSERWLRERHFLRQTKNFIWKLKVWELVSFTPTMVRIIWKILFPSDKDLRQKPWLENLWLCRTRDSTCQRGSREGGLFLKAEEGWSCVNHFTAGPVFILSSAWQAPLPALPGFFLSISSIVCLFRQAHLAPPSLLT